MENAGKIEKVVQSLPVKLTQEETAQFAAELKKLKAQVKTVCPDCKDTGYVGDKGAGVKLNTEIEPCACEKGKQIAGEIGKKVSDLTIDEFKTLMVECFEMLKQREQDTSMKEYNRLTAKPIVVSDISTRDGVPVPKEW